MRRRTKALGFLTILAVTSLVGVWLWWPKADDQPSPASPTAPVSASPAKIEVGKNVHVSLANAANHHMESVVAADGTNAAQLFIASMYQPPGSKKPKLVGYYSPDGGRTWQQSFAPKDEPEAEFNDPTATSGPDGSIYLAYMWKRIPANTAPKYGDPKVGRVDVARSNDGGKTWEPLGSIPQFLDRPWLAVDRSAGPHRRRLYCMVNVYDPALYVSSDQAKTFAAPLIWPRDRKKTFFRPGNPVVLSDGTVVVHYDLRPNDPQKRPHIPVLVSRDGGESFQEATPVNTAWRDGRVETAN